MNHSQKYKLKHVRNHKSSHETGESITIHRKTELKGCLNFDNDCIERYSKPKRMFLYTPNKHMYILNVKIVTMLQEIKT